MRLRGWRLDVLCVGVLVLVWLAFFWRQFTPVEAAQASLIKGDFSDQFVTFGAYQYARFAAGEVPLWNPYNNGGLPFIADTQAAVFYPPRLATIMLAKLGGGWTYHALELEMTAHVLFYTLTMYLLVRRMTRGWNGTYTGSLIAALIGGYGGYMTGYPPLQLALMEAGVWLPLAVLGIYEAFSGQPPAASRQQKEESFSIDGAEHTEKDTVTVIDNVSFFPQLRAKFSRFFSPRPACEGEGPGVRGRTSNLPGVAAVRWPYLIWTGFALGMSWMAGHPQTSFFLTYLLLAYLAYRVYAARLPIWTWLAGAAIFGVIAFGTVAVTLLPGIEYLIQTSRAGFDYADMSHGFPLNELVQIVFPGVTLWSPLWSGLIGLGLALYAAGTVRGQALYWGGVALFALLFSLGGNGPLYPLLYPVVPGLRYFRGQERIAYLYAHSIAIMAGFGAAALARRIRPPWQALLAGAVIVELFAVGLTNPNDDAGTPEANINRNPLIEPVLTDKDVPFRVDGLRVLGGNWGSYYQIADIQGISPLFLTGPQEIIEAGLPDERAWELFSVRYVYSDWDALAVPGEVIAEGEDAIGLVKLHRLTAQRPFAHLLYDAVTVESDEAARAVLADAAFNPRTTAILHTDAPIDLPMTPVERYGTTVTRWTPEKVTIAAETPENAILSLSQVDYPGWYATVDGEDVPLIRAYGGLSALPLPAGQHTIELIYNPITYRIGAVLSALTWLSLIGGALIFGVAALKRRRR
jgi:hypothetical protein